ncbi:MAG TPA: ABC transporter permease subunit [Candidatus Acidoferrum sp.]|nr:ABC transporter permease subunit [Candidatus Acidoferrum sp.]
MRSEKKIIRAAAVCFWLVAWQAAAALLSQDLLLVSPVEVVKTLFDMVGDAGFWRIAMSTMLRITQGFLLAFVFGVVFGAAAAKSETVRALMRPLTAAMRATPVASFIILALLWVGSRGLSTFTAFIMGLPIIYAGTLQGISAIDPKLVEMTRVFGVSRTGRMLYVYLPAVLPSVASSAGVALGMCWKAGVAAEVIGLPVGTIGERLYQAKIYLSTGEVFAWTVVVIGLSALLERAVAGLLHTVAARVERGPAV